MDCSDLPLVEALLAEGNQAVAIQRFDDAFPPLNRGLAILGETYLSPDLIDDSSLKLVLADDLQRKQQDEKAAYIKGRILAERITLFKHKNRCRQSPDGPATSDNAD